MIFGIGVFVCVVIIVLLIVGFLWSISGGETALGVILLLAIIPVSIGLYWCQTHRSVQAQYVGVSKNKISQQLSGPHSSGLVPKPFFGDVYIFPASERYERCEQYTPAIKGSYGVVADICFYYAMNNVDWVKEINRTGSFNANIIMNTWRNSVTDEVAAAFKIYTPEQLSENRSDVKIDIIKNVKPWFDDRGVGLVDVAFKNWEFGSPEVANAFDLSIISQRKITEQSALLEAAKISRQREEFEVETMKLIAVEQAKAISTLGLKQDDIIEWLWIAAMTEAGKMPDTVILGNTPVTVPATP